jgi:hypothetical protein
VKSLERGSYRRVAILLSFVRTTHHGAPFPSSPKGTSLNDYILNALDEEIAKLVQARTILAGSSKFAAKPARNASAAAASKPVARRRLSAKARHAIAEGQRKRWSQVKNQKKAIETVAANEESAAS